MNKKNILSFITFFIPLLAFAQAQPVTFHVTQKQTAADEIQVNFTGTIADGWHVYSTNLGADGPTEATLTTEKAEGAKVLGSLKAQGKEKNVMDEIFGVDRSMENLIPTDMMESQMQESFFLEILKRKR